MESNFLKLSCRNVGEMVVWLTSAYNLFLPGVDDALLLGEHDQCPVILTFMVVGLGFTLLSGDVVFTLSLPKGGQYAARDLQQQGTQPSDPGKRQWQGRLHCANWPGWASGSGMKIFAANLSFIVVNCKG